MIKSRHSAAVCIGTAAILFSAGASAATINLQSGVVNRAIPDNDAAGASSTMTVTAADIGATNGIIDGIVVTLFMSHTFVGDLAFTLTGAGTTITLADRPGEPDDINGDSANLLPIAPITFIDVSPVPAELMGADCLDDNDEVGGDCFGIFAPDEPLATFAGLSILGDWTLNVSDHSGTETGAIVAWAMTVDYTPAVVPVPPALLLFGTALLGLVRRRS